MINEGGKLSEIKFDVAEKRYKIDDNNLVKVLESICRRMIIERRLFTLIEKAQIRNNPQVCVLCDIIET